LRQIGFKGSWSVRDVWRQRDLALAKDALAVTVPSHGVVLLRLTEQAR